MPRIIPPDGRKDAEIVILGEAPGEQEENQGKPFVGPSGWMLFTDWLSRIGIQRKDCLVLNIFWERPPQNKLDRVEDPYKYAEQTARAIQAHPRKLILAVGNHALNFLSSHAEESPAGITSWRGSILRNTTNRFGSAFAGPILPLIHPAAVIRDYSLRPLCLYDILRARNLLTNPSLCDHERNTIHFHQLVRDYGSADAAFEVMYETIEKYIESPAIAFDIETFKKTITCIGIANSEKDAVVLPLTGEFGPSRTAELLYIMSKVLAAPMPKIGQNLNYDVQYLAKIYNIGVRNVWMDTMVAHACIQPEMRHSLEILTSIYTLHPYYKSMRKESYTPSPNEQRDLYNGIDCTVTFEVGMKLYEELRDINRLDLCFDIDMPATKTLTRMEYKGIGVDDKRKEETLQELEQKMQDIIEDSEFEIKNPRSNPQVLAYIKEKLPPTLRKNIISTDKHVLSRLVNRLQKSKKHAKTRRTIEKVIQYRSLGTIKSTFAGAEVSEDGRMHSSFYTWVTSTGRLASRKKQPAGGHNPFGGGMNLQNVPKSMRVWMVPDKDRVIWECDASQIEARITAWVSHDDGYIEAFLSGEDLHSKMASEIFNIPIENVRDVIPGSFYSYRDAGKRAVHAINYRIEAQSLSQYMNEYVPTLNMTKERAQEIIDTFTRLRPGVARWWKWLDETLWNTCTLTNIYGRKRTFLKIRKDSSKEKHAAIFKDATAYIPQGSASDHIKRVMVRVEKRLEKETSSAELFVQVHDSIVGQCIIDEIDKVKKICLEEMERPLPIAHKGILLVVPGDFTFGPSWGECK